MPGLMEKKKSERKSRIFKAAIELFGSVGFAGTTMERIASKAELGVGTLYNYYSTKGDILLSIISDRAEGLEKDFENALNQHTSDILKSLNPYFDIYFMSFSFYNRVIWREFVSYALSKSTSLIEFIAQIDSVFIKQSVKLFTCLKNNGTIRESIDIEKAVQTLYSLIIFHILRYISDDKMTMEDLRSSLDSQTSIMIKGLI